MKIHTHVITRILLLSLLSLTHPAFAQSTDASVITDEDSRALLKQVTEKSILPMYAEFVKASAQMQQQATLFCESPNEGQLKQLETAWSQALRQWQQTDSLLFGPAVEEQIDFAVYFLPPKKQLIKAALNQEGLPTIERLEKTGVGGQGFAAIEYLLFDREKSDAERVQLFTNEKGKQRCTYIKIASQLIAQHAATIHGAWQKGYADAFSTAGNGSAEFIEANQPLEILVNKLFQTVEKVAAKKLAIPLDKKNQGKHANAYKLEAWRSGHSLANIRANIQGLERLLVDGGIVSWLESNQQQALAEALAKQLTRLNKGTFTSDDLFAVIEQDPNQVDAYYADIKALTGLVKNHLAPALGVQLGFNDNDGD